jgi:response regulator RpfG family c-di-GMP phosphodiesterase
MHSNNLGRSTSGDSLQSQARNRRILVIDDNTSIHEDVRKILSPPDVELTALEQDAELLFGVKATAYRIEHDYEIDSAMHGEEALLYVSRSITHQRPYALAFVDVRMPQGIDGIETIKRIWAIDPEMQIVLCTAYSDYSLYDTLRHLGMSDRLLVLKKPYDPMELAMFAITLTEKWNYSREAARLIQLQSNQIDDAQRVLKTLRLCQQDLRTECASLQEKADRLSAHIQQQTIELLGTREITCLALAQLAESRDPETGDHLHRMQAFSQLIAEDLALHGPYVHDIDQDFLENLWRSTPLHDIGKVGIPDHILLKPGKLTPEEFEEMKRHTTIAAEALEIASRHNDCGSFLCMAVEIARHHHEWVNGGGYPDGLTGNNIPLPARIVAVADVFDALTSKRVYKDAMSPERARQIIESESGTHFDPVVVAAFERQFHELLDIQQTINETGRQDGARFRRQFAADWQSGEASVHRPRELMEQATSLVMVAAGSTYDEEDFPITPSIAETLACQ